MNKDILLCKNCEYFRQSQVMGSTTCHHPSSLYDIDRVYGYDIFASCAAMRKSDCDSCCGPDGKFFKKIGTK